MRRIAFSVVIAACGATGAIAHTEKLESADLRTTAAMARSAGEQAFDPLPFAFQESANHRDDAWNWSSGGTVTAFLLNGLATPSYNFSAPVTFSNAASGLSADAAEDVNTAKVSSVPLPGSLSLLLSLMSVYVLTRILAFLLALRSEQWSRQYEQSMRMERLDGHFRV